MIYPKLSTMIRRSFQSLKNIIRWFPIIWNDKDWDHAFLYYILDFKLNNMKKYFSNALLIAQEEYEENIVKDLTECTNMLSNIIEDKIEMDAYDVFCARYPEHNLIQEIDGHRTYSMTKEYAEKYHEIMDVANKNKEEERMNFFKKLGERIEYWWD